MGNGASTQWSAAERERCRLVFQLAKKIVTDGVGEAQAAHGFTVILAASAALFETKPNGRPKLGEFMRPDLFDYREKALHLTDANAYATLCNLAREDGAIVVEWSTGQILGGNYSIVDLSEAQHDMKGGTRHRSASSCAQITGGFVIVASEAECKKLTNAEHVTVFYGNKVPREESLQEQVRGGVCRLSPISRASPA